MRACLAGIVISCLWTHAASEEKKGPPEAEPTPRFVVLKINHRVFEQFQETVKTPMSVKQPIGDAEYAFEVVEFYPHFAISDSTKTIVSLSDEPRNPAFKIRVYKNEEKVEDTWAFYGIKIPHFGRTSYLAFEVLQFEYRGKIIGKVEDEKKDEGAKPETKEEPEPDHEQGR